MTKDAELHAEEDRKRKESVENRNQLDSSIYQMEKMLKDAGDKLPADKKGPIEGAIAEGKKALEDGKPDEIKKAIETLTKVGADLYAAAAASGADMGDMGGPPPPQGGAGSSAKGEPKRADVVDADFEVVEDDKK